MPLYTDQIVQQATGSFEGASGTVTLPGATTAGSLVLVCVGISSGSLTAFANLRTNLPTGGAGSFLRLTGTGNQGTTHSQVDVYAKKNVAAGETSWTLTAVTGTPQVAWSVFELTGVGLDAYDTWYNATADDTRADVTAASVTTGNVPPAGGMTTCYETLGVNVWCATSTDTTTPVLSGYTTTDLVTAVASEASEVSQNGRSNASNAMALGVAFTQVLHLSAWLATANVSPDAYLSGQLVMLYADSAKFRPDYDWIFGAEIGTGTNISVGGAAVGTAPVDVAVGAPEVVSTFKRSGSYSLKLASTAAAESVAKTLADIGYPGKRTWVERFHCYFDTSLPGVDVELYSLEAGSLGNGMTVTYRTASQKVGVKIGTGTEQLSDTTIAADKWVGVDLRYVTSATTHTCDWQVDYDSLDTAAAPVAQTQATKTAMTAADITTVRAGHTTAITATVYYDDIASSSKYEVYPIGDVRIVPLKVDTTDTPFVQGTSTNFKTFVNNGTMSTWTAVDTVNRLQNIPPVVGATASGLAQVTAAAGDHIVIPMETFACAPLYSPRMARVYAAGWAASTTAANGAIAAVQFGVAALGGVQTPADHNWDNSTLRWLCYTLTGNTIGTDYDYNQTRTDNISVQFGFSTDATPDVGICGLLVELCIQPTQTSVVHEAEGAAFSVYQRMDPKSFAIRGLVVTTPAGTRGGNLYTTIDGVDATDYVGPNTIWEKTIEATSITNVSSIGFSPDPTE